MEKHMEALRFVVDHAENYFNDNVDSNSKNSPLHTIIEESFITNHSDRDTDKKSAIAEEAPSDPQVSLSFSLCFFFIDFWNAFEIF